MKRITKSGAQGDTMYIRLDKLPADAKPLEAENGQFVIAHSETGHNHVVLERPTIKHFSAMDKLRSYLVVEEEDAEILHLRDTHTHETLALAPGIWVAIRQREHDVTSGWRVAAD